MRQALVLAALLVGAQSQAPIPPPPVRPPCDNFCCSFISRDPCCGANFTDGSADPCPPGPESGYCTWTGNNLCERNLFGRGGPCAEIEVNFDVVLNATALAQVQQTAAQIAKEANVLLGAALNTVVVQSVEYNAGVGLLSVVLRCPNGGCGSLEYIAQTLCFAGEEVANTGGQVVWQGKLAEGGKCLSVGPNGPTEEQPAGDLADLNPGRVTARTCNGTCVPSVENSTVTVANGQLVQIDFPSVPEVVDGTSISPAFLDSPPVNTFCNVPSQYQGMTHFRMNSSAPIGSRFTVNCPANCLGCDVFLTHYHCPPVSSDFNANYPASLPAAGWTPFSCAPCLTDGNEQFPAVAYRIHIAGGTSVTTPPVTTQCLKYYGIFAGPGADCEANENQDEDLCAKAGPRCVFRDGACVSDFCPKRPVQPPKPCTTPPGLQCPVTLSSADFAAALALIE